MYRRAFCEWETTMDCHLFLLYVYYWRGKTVALNQEPCIFQKHFVGSLYWFMGFKMIGLSMWVGSASHFAGFYRLQRADPCPAMNPISFPIEMIWITSQSPWNPVEACCFFPWTLTGERLLSRQEECRRERHDLAEQKVRGCFANGLKSAVAN